MEKNIPNLKTSITFLLFIFEINKADFSFFFFTFIGKKILSPINSEIKEKIGEYHNPINGRKRISSLKFLLYRKSYKIVIKLSAMPLYYTNINLIYLVIKRYG